VVLLQQLAQVEGAALHVGGGIKRMGDAELGGGLGHELHQSLRALGRDGARIVAALGADHAVDEVGVHLLLLASGAHRLLDGVGTAVAGGGGGGGRGRVVLVLEGGDLVAGNVDEVAVALVLVKSSETAADLLVHVGQREAVLQARQVAGPGTGGGSHEEQNQGPELIPPAQACSIW
jgi:hypothetical protein